MIITTTDSIQGHDIYEYLGIVQAYIEDEEENPLGVALKVLKKKAENLDADAIVGYRVTSSGTYTNARNGSVKGEVFAFGTAVKLK